MCNLGRVNLLVGTNNSGKSSVLEAIHLLVTAGSPASIWRPLFYRGEGVSGDDRDGRRSELEYDISHLFTGHDIKESSHFTISAANGVEKYLLTCSLGQRKNTADLAEPDEDRLEPGPRYAFLLHGNPAPRVNYYPVTRRFGITGSALSQRSTGRVRDVASVQFIPTTSYTSEELTQMWGTVALTKQEDMVVNALKKIDDDIERIASVPVGLQFHYSSRGGFKVKLKNSEQPIPIGSMGDGVWRMLTIAIALARSKGGVLLIDEVDTGLHYSVMDDMWKLISLISLESNIQVFATTHSYDCVNSLASICEPSDKGGNVTIQRIETGKSKSVMYDENEIMVAAKRHIETR